MNALEIEEQIGLFRARVKALRIKGWNKNVWAVETEAEKFITEALAWVPEHTKLATGANPSPKQPQEDI